MERMEALTNYYTTHNEDARLTPKRGMVEFLTTIHYVEKYLKPGMRILEIGAGTGRYSHYFAQNGYAVDAVELMECNIEVFKTNTPRCAVSTTTPSISASFVFSPNSKIF